MTHIERVDLIHQDFEVSEVKADSEVSDEILISEILILVILWVVFLVEDSADDLEKKAFNEVKISK
jgi:hypothetical protein